MDQNTTQMDQATTQVWPQIKKQYEDMNGRIDVLEQDNGDFKKAVDDLKQRVNVLEKNAHDLLIGLGILKNGFNNVFGNINVIFENTKCDGGRQMYPSQMQMR